ncbi:hypothetical protein DE146DRAFT_160845 [Phaeosphaeria sp. MPI-PUGE-AT-0046c]|nr:hypothetical protein DE146DRAFT_160845 [Phaeosphaeria sp. MPI-PUGE-AT-0046c]
MAAEDVKGKKRKGASDAAPKAKKPRKSDDVAAITKPVKAAKAAATNTATKPPKSKAVRKEAAVVVPVVEAPATDAVKDAAKATKGKKKSKVAADTNVDVPEVVMADVQVAEEKPKKGKKAKAVVTEEVVVAEAPKTKAAKKSKKADPAPLVEAEVVEAAVEAPVKKSKKAKGSKKQEEPVEEVAEVVIASDAVDGEVEEDDQTAALLAGFESDDSDPDEDEDFDEDAPVPKLSKKQRTALEKATQGPKSNEPGVVYVGRVPRGFFEPQMKKYFSQFGRVNRLRLSRNKKTGASKHYAFVEFSSSEVADIVARTMNNYLLFGHILRCSLIPAEQVHADLFKGAGDRFKVDPRNKKAGLQMERGVERAQWEKRVEKENKRRTDNTKQLKEDFGYEYAAPAVKAVTDVPKQLLNGDAQPQITDAPAEEVTPVAQPKAKKGKKAAVDSMAVEADLQAEIAANVGAPTPEKKTKTAKKRKSDVVLEETSTVIEEPTPTEVTVTTKKTKVTKAAPATEEPAEKKRKAKAEQDVAKPKKTKKAKA